MFSLWANLSPLSKSKYVSEKRRGSEILDHEGAKARLSLESCFISNIRGQSGGKQKNVRCV